MVGDVEPHCVGRRMGRQ